MDNYYVKLAISALLKAHTNYFEALKCLREAGMDGEMVSVILKDSKRIQKWIDWLLFEITKDEDQKVK